MTEVEILERELRENLYQSLSIWRAEEILKIVGKIKVEIFLSSYDEGYDNGRYEERIGDEL